MSAVMIHNEYERIFSPSGESEVMGMRMRPLDIVQNAVNSNVVAVHLHQYLESLRGDVVDQCMDLTKHLVVWKASKHLGLVKAMRRYKIKIGNRGNIEMHSDGLSLESIIEDYWLRPIDGVEDLAAKLPEGILGIIKDSLNNEIDKFMIDNYGRIDDPVEARLESKKTGGLVLIQKKGRRFVWDRTWNTTTGPMLAVCA